MLYQVLFWIFLRLSMFLKNCPSFEFSRAFHCFHEFFIEVLESSIALIHEFLLPLWIKITYNLTHMNHFGLHQMEFLNGTSRSKSVCCQHCHSKFCVIYLLMDSLQLTLQWTFIISFTNFCHQSHYIYISLLHSVLSMSSRKYVCRIIHRHQQTPV